MKLIFISFLIMFALYSTFINQTNAFIANWLNHKTEKLKDNFSNVKYKLSSNVKEFVNII
jgi:hypothetical protein